MDKLILRGSLVAVCGCTFEDYVIQLDTDGSAGDRGVTNDSGGRDTPSTEASVDASPVGFDSSLDAPQSLQRSCAPPRPQGCGQVRLEGGSFRMGDAMASDPRGLGSRAMPVQRQITLNAFMIDQFEVTVGRFRRFVAATGMTPDVDFGVHTGSDQCNWPGVMDPPEFHSEHPMNCVDHRTATLFCAWETTGGRLPTEAQWEYAARGAANRFWPWGGAENFVLDRRACWGQCGGGDCTGTCVEEDRTFASGATPEGVWHLIGNVWEWTADWYAPFSDALCWGDAARRDPECANIGDGLRTVRGGGWSGFDPPDLRSGSRFGGAPYDLRNMIGFRCVAPAP